MSLKSSSHSTPDATGTPDAKGRRRFHRTPCYWPALCVAKDHRTFETTVVDSSVDGFGLATAIDADVDDIVQLHLHEIGVFACRVAWIGADRTGLQIIYEFDAEQIDFLAGDLRRA